MPRYRFHAFVLDTDDRRLTRDGEGVEVSQRYLDALALLVGADGRLVTKDRFMAEVWRGVPVTDEALTQCIRSLRRALGDEAQAPRFIATVPKHGYRFVAAVERDPGNASAARPTSSIAPAVAARVVGGTFGAGVAGAIGGLAYGLVASDGRMGAVSTLLVLMTVTTVVALAGGAAVATGIAIAMRGHAASTVRPIVGGATGGLAIGALFALVGRDAFALLLGHAPGAVTGAPEGAVLGAGVGLALVAARRHPALAVLIGAATGLLVALAGGRLLGGSLAALAQDYPGSRLHLDAIGALTGEAGFGPVARALTASAEAALFTAGTVAGMRRATSSSADDAA